MCDYENEEWRDIEGHEGYQVSSCGRTKVLEKFVEFSDGRQRVFPEKILKLKTNKTGQVLTSLNDGRSCSARVDRLVAEAFLPNEDDKEHVLHVDGDKANCAASNLRWATIEELAQAANDALPMEEDGVVWCGVRGYEDLYQIGTNGEARSLSKAVKYGHGDRVLPGRVMTPLIDNCGYEFIRLRRDDNTEARRIDTMVADAFLPENCDRTIVVHKDGDILNSRVENLARMTFDEYVTFKKQEFIASVSEPDENWRDIPDFFNHYMVSDHGRVLSLPRFANNAQGVMEVAGTVLTPKVDEFGYRRVILSDGSKNKTIAVHRLVAKAFCANPRKMDVVNHLDMTPGHDWASNLAWVSTQENVTYGDAIAKRLASTDHKKARSRRGAPILQFDLDGEIVRCWNNVHEMHEALGFRVRTVLGACWRTGHRGLQKGHAFGYKWYFEEDYPCAG